MAKVILGVILLVTILAFALQATRAKPTFSKHNDLSIQELHKQCLDIKPGASLEDLAEVFGQPRPPRGVFESLDEMDFRIFSPPEYSSKYNREIVAEIDMDTKKVLKLICSDKRNAFDLNEDAQ